MERMLDSSMPETSYNLSKVSNNCISSPLQVADVGDRGISLDLVLRPLDSRWRLCHSRDARSNCALAAGSSGP